MGDIASQILDGISNDIPEAFLGAAEYGRALTFGTDDHVGLVAPFQSALRIDPPTREGGASIVEALCGYARSDGQNLSAAFAALASYPNAKLRPFLTEQLRARLEDFMEQNDILHNIICALENQGVRMRSAPSHGVSTIELNVESARSFLRKRGVVVPW